jgi:fructose-1-phosphate kinase PfkB-like protein
MRGRTTSTASSCRGRTGASATWPARIDTLDQATGSDTLVVLSGSQPPGVAKNFPAILAEHVSERAARLIVDTSGPALFNLVEAPHAAIHVLRMDGEEAEELAGRPLPRPEDSAEFAQGLVTQGVGSHRHRGAGRGRVGARLGRGALARGRARR